MFGFTVVEGSLFDVLISDPTMEAVMDTLDHGTIIVTLKYDFKVAVLDLLP